jgi:DNA-binding NarL/FixJ family response regulator
LAPKGEFERDVKLDVEARVRQGVKAVLEEVLEEEPIPLKIIKRFAPYHAIQKTTERRMAIVELHSEGWSAKAIAGYLKTSKPTVYRALRK